MCDSVRPSLLATNLTGHPVVVVTNQPGIAKGTLSEEDLEAVNRRLAELLAEELRQAQQILGEITGEFTAEDLLGRIFSSFCIGK